MKILDFVRSLFNRTTTIWRTLRESDAGIAVNPFTARQCSVFAACVDILAADIGGLPFVTFQRTSSGRRRATEHPNYPLLHDAPNEFMTSQNWREYVIDEILYDGNSYSFIDRDQRYRPIGLYPLPSPKVQPFRHNGQLLYAVDGVDSPLSAADVLHIPGLSFDGVQGRSIITDHADTIGVSLATNQYSSRFFANSGIPSGYLEYPGQLTPEAKASLANSWHENYGGSYNAGKTPVASGGLKYTKMGLSPEEAQFLETKKYQAIDICRLPGLRIPPHMIGELDRATWGNLEQQGQSYVTFSLRRWLLKIEHECNRKLFAENEKSEYYAEMLVDDLQRGDQDSRYKNYATAIQWGWTTPAQVAEAENMETDNLLDVPLTPLT